jgi:hypothetical protein
MSTALEIVGWSFWSPETREPTEWPATAATEHRASPELRQELTQNADRTAARAVMQLGNRRIAKDRIA